MTTHKVSEAPSNMGPIDDDMTLEGELVAEPFKEERTVRTGDKAGEKYERLIWKFIVTDEGDFEDKPIRGDTSTAFNNHPDCKFRNWAMALLGGELPVGFELDTEALVGMRGRLIIGRRDYEDKNTGEPRVYNFVKDIRPLSGGASSRPATDAGNLNEEPF